MYENLCISLAGKLTKNGIDIQDYFCRDEGISKNASGDIKVKDIVYAALVGWGADGKGADLPDSIKREVILITILLFVCGSGVILASKSREIE